MSDLLQGIAALIVAIGGVYGAMRGFRAKKKEDQAAKRERDAAAVEKKAADEKAADEKKAAEQKAVEQAAAIQAAQTRQDDRDQLQEDLQGLRDEIRSVKAEHERQIRQLRTDSERGARYQTAYSRHLENEIGALRAAWPPGVPLPDRPPPPRWDETA